MNIKNRTLLGLTVLFGALSFFCLAFAGTIKYAYDDAGRLTRVEYPDGTAVVYAYDAAGNRTAMTVTGGGAGETHRLTVSISGSGTVRSDPAGIDCGGDCEETYDGATSVTLSADPGTGYRFSAWGGDCGSCGADPTCVVVMDADKSCAAAFTPVDSDGDGVSDIVEDGDRNGDGVPDRRQSDVASFPAATGNGDLTVEVRSPGCGLREVSGIRPPAADPEGYAYPYGLVKLRIPCSEAVVRVYFHQTADLSGYVYRKYGPTIPGDQETTRWYTLPGVTFGSVEVGGRRVAYAEFRLTDGGLGDDTPEDGVIVEPGGPGRKSGGAVPVPAMNTWGMLFLIVCVSGLVLHRLRSRKGYRAG